MLIVHGRYDGAALGDPFQPPVHKGELPKAEGEEVVYTGSCHCGAVTVATTSKPLDETFEKTIECNCSSCERVSISTALSLLSLNSHSNTQDFRLPPSGYIP